MNRHVIAWFAAVCLTTGLAWSQPQAPSAPSPTPPEPGSAQPPPEPRFGDAGRIAVGADFNISFGHMTHAGQFDVPQTTVTVKPAGDVFVTKNISIGGILYFQHVDTQAPVFGGQRLGFIDTAITTYGAAVSLGVNLPFGDVVSLWPRASAGIWTSKTSWQLVESLDPNGRPNLGYTENAVWLGLYAPILIHPVRHLFLGFGPDMFLDLSHAVAETERKRTYLGASSVVGGWF